MWGYIAIAGVAFIVLAGLLGRPRKKTTAEIEGFRADINPALGGFIRAVNQVNRTDDPEYVRALDALRAARNDVLGDSRKLLASREAPFGLKHSVLIAISALREPGALDLLSEVALNPQPLPPDPPPDRSVEFHDAGGMESATILALDALEGIEALADDAVPQALALLGRAAESNSNAVKAIALTALSARPERRELFDRAKAKLPRDLKHLALMQRVSVKDVPQVKDPRENLVGEEKGIPSAPAITDGGKPNNIAVQPISGAPRAGRS